MDKEKYKEKQDIFSRLMFALSLVLILGGLCISLYPFASNYLAKKNQAEVIKTYNETVSSVDDERIQAEWKLAQTYNENLSGEPVHDPFVAGSGYAVPDNYDEVLNINGDGVMAYIEIPKISVYLPIYHGTEDESMTKGVGHIEATSLPIGGNSTHCVLTGHTGLPSSELFTRIDELEMGDIFYIHVLNEVLAYKVYETKVILPDEIDELQITSGYDWVTLVTCTPYGVNTHRLLVKAERTEYVEHENTSLSEIYEENNESVNYYLIGVMIGFAILIGILIILLVMKRLNRKSKT